MKKLFNFSPPFYKVMDRYIRKFLLSFFLIFIINCSFYKVMSQSVDTLQNINWSNQDTTIHFNDEIISPVDTSQPSKIYGTSNVKILSSQHIELMPGFRATATNSTYNFLARIDTSIASHPLLTASITFIQNVCCSGCNNGYLIATGAGGIPPLNYSWSNGENGTNDSLLAAGFYTITVTDSVGYISTASATIIPPIIITPDSVYNPNDYAISDSVLWFTFTADTTHYHLDVVLPIDGADTPLASINHIYVYAGICGNMTLILDSTINSSLSIVHLILDSLTIGNIYYIKVTNASMDFSNHYFGLNLSKNNDASGQISNTLGIFSGCGYNYIISVPVGNSPYISTGMNGGTFPYIETDQNGVTITGSGFPATLNVSGLPTCSTIIHAYLYFTLSFPMEDFNDPGDPNLMSWYGYSPYNPSVTIQCPCIGCTYAPSPVEPIGISGEICWNYFGADGGGTATYRIEIPQNYIVNGNYVITMTSNNPLVSLHPEYDDLNKEVEGASLLVIYSDPSQSSTGNLIIYDGCIDEGGGYVVHGNWTTGGNSWVMPMSFSSQCASTLTNSFMIISGLQNNDQTAYPDWKTHDEHLDGFYVSNQNTINSPPLFSQIWNVDETSLIGNTVNSGLNTGWFTVASECGYIWENYNDCYAVAVVGLYYQTSCQTCIPIQKLQVSISPTNNAICAASNGSANASVTGGDSPYSYNWSNGETTNPATGLAPGIYTVTVSDIHGCTGTASVTINQTSINLQVNLNHQNATCESLNSGTANVTGTGNGTAPYTYLWNSNPIQTTQTATGLSAGTYEVTVTDVHGCTGTATVIIQPATGCCWPGATTIISTSNSNTSSSFFLNHNLQGTVYIESPFTIVANDNFQFLIGTNVIIDPNVTIFVESGALLQINGSHLHACSYMWDGIDVSAGGTVNVWEQSTIEDARAGVYVHGGGTYNINNSTFTRNYEHIKIVNGIINPGFINFSTFSCPSILTPAVFPPNPLPNDVTYKAIDIGSTTNVTISSNNTFYDSYYGIYSIGANLTVEYNSFIATPFAPWTHLKAIYAAGTSNVNRTLTVDNNNFLKYWKMGIDACIDLYVNINNNQFIGELPSLTGVYVHNINNRTININYNNPMSNFSTAEINLTWNQHNSVQINNNNIDHTLLFGIACSNNYNSSIQIEYNQISNIYNYGINCSTNTGNNIQILNNTLTDIYKYGIYSFDNFGSLIFPHKTYINYNNITANSSTTNFVTAIFDKMTTMHPYYFYHDQINYNLITNVGCGINTLNVFTPDIESNGSNPNNTPNPITIKPSPWTNNPHYCDGILTQSSEYGYIYKNYLQSVPNAPTGSWWIEGIRVDNLSDYTLVQCNNTTNFSNHFFFNGTNAGSKFYSNDLNANNDINTWGIYAANYLGSQGDNSHAIMDEWLLGGGSFNCEAYSTTPSISFHVFDHLYPYSPSPNCYLSFIDLINLPTNGGIEIDCNTRITLDIVEMQKVVHNTDSSFNTDSIFCKFSKIEAYHLLKNNDSLQSLDSYFPIFVDSVSNLAYGKLDSLSESINPNMDSATISKFISCNASLNPADTIDYLLQVVNSIRLEGISNDNSLLPPDELGQLFEIASLCPYRYGEAVYEARAILINSLDTLELSQYWNSCEYPIMPDSGARKAEININKKSKETIFSKLYPNPNDGNMQLDYILKDGENGVLTIYDATGRKLDFYNLIIGSNTLKLDETMLNDGVYFYQLLINNSVKISDKLVIIK